MADHDPFLYRDNDGKLHQSSGGRDIPIDPSHPGGRGGVPSDKFGAWSIPLVTEDKRQAVMMMLFPPEALRDQSLDVIRAAINLNAAGLLETMALEIYKAYTSEPADSTGTQNVADALAAHAKAMRRG